MGIGRSPNAYVAAALCKYDVVRMRSRVHIGNAVTVCKIAKMDKDYTAAA